MNKPYYGWWIVAGSILCQFAFLSLGQIVIGVFMKPVIQELGWQVWQFTLGPSLAVGAGAFVGVIAGPIVDKKGPRILILVGALVTAICFYGLGLQSNIWIFLVLYTVSGAIGWNLFGPMVVNATLSKWFIRKRGWALAIGSIGISLAGLITPVSMTAVVDALGWRNGYHILALFALIIVLPAAMIMRRTPEDFGLSPDGDAASAEKHTEFAAKEPRAFTRAEAIRTRTFWLLVSGFTLNRLALSSVLVHAMPFVTDANFSRTTAALSLSVNGLGNFLSKPIWGYSLQRVDTRKLVLAAYSISSLGIALMLTAAGGETYILFAGFFFYGFGFGGTIPLSEFLWATYFGRDHIGAIRGIGQPMTIAGSALGPVLVGLWYDASRTYQPAFLTIIGVYLTGAILIWMSRVPLRSENKR